MSEGEVFVLGICVVLGAVAAYYNSTASLSRLYFRNNPAPGIIRLGVILAMAWIGLVIWQFADPSVTGIYVIFYLVMGYAAVKICGQTVASLYGLRARIDVGERRNVPAAIVIAAFTFSTGLIFGGSIWGEADPLSGYEGGWWIPLGFFLLGWIGLALAFAIFEIREPGHFARRLRRERNVGDARAAATFLIGCAIVLTDAVAGDFWGWRHGLLSFGVLAGMLLVHEALAPKLKADGTSHAEGGRSRVEHGTTDTRRVAESIGYLAIGWLVWLVNRGIDRMWGGG
jgi:hypothetical protein